MAKWCGCSSWESIWQPKRNMKINTPFWEPSTFLTTFLEPQPSCQEHQKFMVSTVLSSYGISLANSKQLAQFDFDKFLYFTVLSFWNVQLTSIKLLSVMSQIIWAASPLHRHISFKVHSLTDWLHCSIKFSQSKAKRAITYHK